MVIRLTPDEPWTFTCEAGTADVQFASISPVDGSVTFTVECNGDMIDRVHTAVPHSWWPMSGQSFCPRLNEGDTLTLRAERGDIDVRLDLLDHEA